MLVPITAIVAVVWQKTIKNTQQHLQEIARINAMRGDAVDGNSLSELNALRRELAALRDTTTQYDLSVERNMSELIQRLQALEARAVPQRPTSSKPTESIPAPRASYYNVPSETEAEPLRIRSGNRNPYQRFLSPP